MQRGTAAIIGIGLAIAIGLLGLTVESKWVFLFMVALLLGGLLVVAVLFSPKSETFALTGFYVGMISVVFVVGLTIVLMSMVGPIVAFLGTAALAGVYYLQWSKLRPDLRAYREEAGLCVRCGYDLRHSVEKCPECAAPIPESLARRRRIFAELRARRGEGPAVLPGEVGTTPTVSVPTIPQPNIEAIVDPMSLPFTSTAKAPIVKDEPIPLEELPMPTPPTESNEDKP